MRLTKRQLKRIIREEYTRLKRRGLITEGLQSVGNTSTFQCEIPELAGQGGGDLQQLRTDYSMDLEDMCYDALEACLAQSGGTVVHSNGETYEGLTSADFELLPSAIYRYGRDGVACRWRLI